MALPFLPILFIFGIAAAAAKRRGPRRNGGATPAALGKLCNAQLEGLWAPASADTAGLNLKPEVSAAIEDLARSEVEAVITLLEGGVDWESPQVHEWEAHSRARMKELFGGCDVYRINDLYKEGKGPAIGLSAQSAQVLDSINKIANEIWTEYAATIETLTGMTIDDSGLPDVSKGWVKEGAMEICAGRGDYGVLRYRIWPEGDAFFVEGWDVDGAKSEILTASGVEDDTPQFFPTIEAAEQLLVEMVAAVRAGGICEQMPPDIPDDGPGRPEPGPLICPRGEVVHDKVLPFPDATYWVRACVPEELVAWWARDTGLENPIPQVIVDAWREGHRPEGWGEEPVGAVDPVGSSCPTGTWFNADSGTCWPNKYKCPPGYYYNFSTEACRPEGY